VGNGDRVEHYSLDRGGTTIGSPSLCDQGLKFVAHQRILGGGSSVTAPYDESAVLAPTERAFCTCMQAAEGAFVF
jgi:hypothetical protein